MALDFDSYDPVVIKRLHSAIDWSLEKIKDRRETRFDHLAQYVGHLYGEEAAEDSVPINMIGLGIDILQRFISPHSPQVCVGSNYRSLLPAAYDLELALNQESKRINLSSAFNTWVIEALLCMGVLEVGITSKDTPPDGEGYQYDPGHLFVDPVLFDRLILDMYASSWETMSYVGHDYQVPYEWVKDNPEFEKSIRDAIKPYDEGYSLDEADYQSEHLSRGDTSVETFMPMLALRQVYLPQHSKVLQFVVGQEEKRPLKETKWEGPEHGMYIPLRFGLVPGNILPNAPVLQWAPLHDQLNSLWNKVTDQGERQKTLLLIRGAAAADGSRIIKANDGDAIYSEDPGGAVEMSTGGANPQTFALAMQCKDTLDWFAGNLSALGGLAAQSETLGQDKLLTQAASGKPQNLQEITMEAQMQVFEDMAFWLYNDPISEYHLIKPIGNSGLSLETTWGPEQRGIDPSDPNSYEIDRRGELVRYDFTIDPFSNQARSPSQKSNLYMQYLLQLLIPGEQGMMAQGMGLDWEYIVKTVAKLNNMPEISRSIRFVEGEAYPERGQVEKPGMSPNTTRTNVRVNKPAATQQGKDQVLIQHLMGASSQPSEMAGLMRQAV